MTEMSDTPPPSPSKRRGRPPKSDAAKPKKPVRPKRPTEFTPALANAICQSIADGSTVTQICKLPDMPKRETLRRWEASHPEFRVSLDVARVHRADSRFDQVAALADELKSGQVDPHSSRVRMEALKWLAAKESPRYADRQVTQVTGADGRTLAEELGNTPAERDLETARRIAHLLQRGDRHLDQLQATSHAPAPDPPSPRMMIDVTPAVTPVEIVPPPIAPQEQPKETVPWATRMAANRDMDRAHSKWLEAQNRHYEQSPRRPTSYRR